MMKSKTAKPSAKLKAKLLNWKPKFWEEVENRLQGQASFFENPNYFANLFFYFSLYSIDFGCLG